MASVICVFATCTIQIGFIFTSACLPNTVSQFEQMCIFHILILMMLAIDCTSIFSNSTLTLYSLFIRLGSLSIWKAAPRLLKMVVRPNKKPTSVIMTGRITSTTPAVFWSSRRKENIKTHEHTASHWKRSKMRGCTHTTPSSKTCGTSTVIRNKTEFPNFFYCTPLELLVI